MGFPNLLPSLLPHPSARLLFFPTRAHATTATTTTTSRKKQQRRVCERVGGSAAAMLQGRVFSPQVAAFCFSSSNHTPTQDGSEASNNKLSLPLHNSSSSSNNDNNNKKWRLLLAYDGSRYAGWQYQPSPPTIQCLLENALTRVTKLGREHLCVVGASRTDRGVHAWGQVAHFVTPFNYPSLDSIHLALNGLLPPDIRVREVAAALPEYHARFSAVSKIYHYKIYNDTIMDPLQRQLACHSAYKLNTTVMREAAKHFVGIHDFSAFANAMRHEQWRDPIKTITRFDVIEMGPVLQLEVEGSGFLYRQVRNMVALLLQVGREAVPPDIVIKILASRDRTELAKYAASAPPHGLCLMSVKYNEEHLRPPGGCPPQSFGRHHTISKCKLPFY